MPTPETPGVAHNLAKEAGEQGVQVPKQPEATAVAKLDEATLEQRLLSVAQTPLERAEVFTQLSEYRRSKIIRIAASAITELSWGKALSEYARAAIARYALETGTDPVRHWIVLGTKLYDTAALWFDLAASQPDYAGHSEPEYINDDERADDEERNRRRALRVKHNVPEDVKGACIVVIYRVIAGVRTPFVGVNWAGNRKCYVAQKNAMGTKFDPIGEQDPGKTSFTRAFRRAAKTAWPIWPYRRQLPPDAGLSVEELGRAEVSDVIQQGRDAEKLSGATEPEPGMWPANCDTPPAAVVQSDLAIRTSTTVGEIDADAAQRAYDPPPVGPKERDPKDVEIPVGDKRGEKLGTLTQEYIDELAAWVWAPSFQRTHPTFVWAVEQLRSRTDEELEAARIAADEGGGS